MKEASVYIHIPFCVSKCDYCDFFSIPCGGRSVPDEYVSALCREIRWRMQDYGAEACRTLYIGGGTPSLLGREQLLRIVSAVCLDGRAPFSSELEFTVEANPDDITEALLGDFACAGVNRLSLGVQSLCDSSLRAVHRRAGRAKVERALCTVDKLWSGRLSVDLIAGLPGETKQSFKEGLERVMRSRPCHVSMYSLTVEEGTPLWKSLSCRRLAYDADAADELWLLGRDFLEGSGLYQYEVSNFARKGFECSHNLAYWSHCDYIGCGSGATGTVYRADGSGRRATGICDIKKYQELWLGHRDGEPAPEAQMVEELSVQESEFEFFMMGLRRLFGITRAEYEKCFKRGFPVAAERLFRQWHKKGLSEITELEGDTRFSLGKRGILFLNRFLEELLL